MKNRTTNPHFKQFKDYGGRGIAVCPEWHKDFPQFLKDMGPRPTPKHTIERRDNDGPYCAWNCYWATRYEQMSNTRHTRWITYKGRTQTLTAWSKEMGIADATLSRRLYKDCWPVALALTTPPSRIRNKKLSFPCLGTRAAH